jgi:putative aminopeptidase FrvX
MEKQRLLALTRGVLEQPTAPFHEEKVAAHIWHLLRKCPHVSLRRDPFGNIIARYARGKKKAQYAFAAHMDHPGWVRQLGKWKFLGGVPRQFLSSGKRKEFGSIAMWDLPACKIRGDRIYSRACDDLIGCSAIVATFKELERTKAQCSCLGIFTRAEEVGFVGAIKLAQSQLIPKSVTVISLETSAERSPAKMGNGPIIRVGDRRSIFNSAATAELVQIATDRKIKFQRCLMDGGTCEATAYQLYGYRTAALAIALGNYHNCVPVRTRRSRDGRYRVGSEFVSIIDLAGLVKLCTAIAMVPAEADLEKELRRKLEANVRRFEKLQFCGSL